MTVPVAEQQNGASVDRSRAGHGRTTGARALVLVATVLVAIAVAPVAVGLAGAVVLYEVFARPYARLSRRLSPGFAVLLIDVAAVAIVVVPLAWLGYHVSKRVPAILASITAFSEQAKSAAPTGVLGQIQAQGATAVSNGVNSLPGMFLSLARNTAWALLNWSIALFGLSYLLGSARTLWPRFARLLPLSAAGAETLRVRFHDITEGMVAGTLLSAAIQGVAIGIGFWLAGLPDALFWGACAAIATLIPVVGNATVTVPALILLLVRQDYRGAIAMAVFSGPLPPIIDRVVRATVSRRVGSVHPMITIVGALVGVGIAGVAGLILGPVALATYFVLLEVYENERLGEQPS